MHIRIALIRCKAIWIIIVHHVHLEVPIKDHHRKWSCHSQFNRHSNKNGLPSNKFGYNSIHSPSLQQLLRFSSNEVSIARSCRMSRKWKESDTLQRYYHQFNVEQIWNKWSCYNRRAPHSSIGGIQSLTKIEYEF